MQLNILERILLLGALPGEGNVLTLKIVRQLREALSFTEEELAEFEIRQDGERTIWNPSKEDGDGKEIAIGDAAHAICVSALKKLNDQQKLTESHLSLCDKFGITGE